MLLAHVSLFLFITVLPYKERLQYTPQPFSDIIACITAMRFIPGQSVHRLNLAHGFRHISMPEEKFPIYPKLLKKKTIDHSQLTVQTKSKTINDLRCSFTSFIPSIFWRQDLNLRHHGYKPCALPAAPLLYWVSQLNQIWCFHQAALPCCRGTESGIFVM